MNKQNIRLLVDHLRVHPERFNMQMWLLETATDRPLSQAPKNLCGTTACIAGHTNILFGNGDQVSNSCLAAETLGLDDQQAHQLFFGAFRRSDQRLEDVTLDQAIEELERLIA